MEGLSDTVFGFAITLLVVSLEVPKNVHDLMALSKGFIPFVASFFVLFSIWRGQFDFFRRYGLEDPPTVWLTGLLLVLVLFLIYPLKFLFTVFGAAVLGGGSASLKAAMPFESFPKVLGLYALAFFGIGVTFSLLYRHAARQADKLELNAVEMFDTIAMQRRWTRAAAMGAAMSIWSGSLLAIGDHLHARDNVFSLVYFGGTAVVFGLALSQLLLRRSQARARRALARPPGDDMVPVL